MLDPVVAERQPWLRLRVLPYVAKADPESAGLLKVRQLFRHISSPSGGANVGPRAAPFSALRLSFYGGCGDIGRAFFGGRYFNGLARKCVYVRYTF